MKELTDEQYKVIGRSLGWMEDYAVKGGRRAYVASFPHAVAEALEAATPDENNKFRACGPLTAIQEIFAYRLARLTAKPDAAVEAVTELFAGARKSGREFSATELVAAVDAARAKEAK